MTKFILYRELVLYNVVANYVNIPIMNKYKYQ